MDPDPYHFKEVMYLKPYFLYILTWFSLSVGPTGPNQKTYFVKFSLPVNFVVLIRVAYGSGSNNTRELIPDPDPQHASRQENSAGVMGGGGRNKYGI